jgi:hypothetical protein
MAHLVLEHRLRLVRQDRAADRAVIELGRGGHADLTQGQTWKLRPQRLGTKGPKSTDLSPSVTRNVTQNMGKPCKYCLIRISAGEEFRGEAWEVDPKELAVRLGGGA